MQARRWWPLAFFSLFSGALAAAPLTVAVPADVVISYREFVGQRPILKVNDFGRTGLWRDVVELVLFHQAMVRGGYLGELELVEVDNYRRLLRGLEHGQYDFLGTTAWLSDLKAVEKPVHISLPMIRNNEYRVGLYTSEYNAEALAVRSLEQLHRLRAVSSTHWSADWRELERLGFRELHDSPRMDSMVKMVLAGRADVTLLAFRSSIDFAYEDKNGRLVPIPDVAIVLSDSRHYGASSRSAETVQAFKNLQRGLKKMRAEKLIERAYRQVGVFDPRVSNWTVLNDDNFKTVK